jgi:nucleoside 2-deoxyribosyltransferase
MNLLRQANTRVFVATGFAQKQDGAALMDSLRKRGAVITCDWTVPTQLSREEIADRDEAALKTSQVLVVLMSLKDYDYKGTFFEMGFALGAGIPIILITPFTRSTDAVCVKNVYFHLKSFIRHRSVDAFLTAMSQ